MTDDPEEPEADETREAFADALAGWGLTPSQVAETLEATGFGLGLVELRAPAGGQSPGIAIVVDDRRHPELRELFDWRAATPTTRRHGRSRTPRRFASSSAPASRRCCASRSR